MAKMNFKDALNKSLQVTKQYIDEQIVENAFSGDYNDLENKPYYDSREYTTSTFEFDGVYENTDREVVSNYVEIANTTYSHNVYFVKLDYEVSLLPPKNCYEDNNFSNEYTASCIDQNGVIDEISYEAPYELNTEKKYAYVGNFYFVYEDITYTEITNDVACNYDLTQGIWARVTIYDTGVSHIPKKINLTHLSSGEKKDIDVKYLETYDKTKPGLKVEGMTFTVYNMDTGEYEERVAQRGAEIFNSYELGKFDTIATGECSHAEGDSVATGDYAHGEGADSHARGFASHSEGYMVVAEGGCSHVEGWGTYAKGDKSHAEGYDTATYGVNSHAEGNSTIASSDNQHVQGKFNIEDTENKYAHIVGNGTKNSARSNAHTLDWDGNAWFQGNVSINGTPTNDNDLVTKKYVDHDLVINSLDNGEWFRISKDNTDLISTGHASFTVPDNLDLPTSYCNDTKLMAEFKGKQENFVASQYSMTQGKMLQCLLPIDNSICLGIMMQNSHPNDGAEDGAFDDFTIEVMFMNPNTFETIVPPQGLLTEDIVLVKSYQYFNDNFTRNNIAFANSLANLNSEASGINSIAVGGSCTATGNMSAAFGKWSEASGFVSFAAGEGNATGDFSHAVNSGTASGEYSHAVNKAYATGESSHAENNGNAHGLYSHAEGYATVAYGENQHVQGRLNIADDENKYAHIVGNGTKGASWNDPDTRSNAHTLDWEGNAWYQGQVQGTNLPHDTRVFEETELTFDGNTEGKETVPIEDPDAPVSLSNVDSKLSTLSSGSSYYVKTSDKAISYEEFCNTIGITTAVITDTETGELRENEVPIEEIRQALIKINDNVFVVGYDVEYGNPPYIIITHENITVDSVIGNTTNNSILTSGIWFMSLGGYSFISKFKYQGIISGELKKLDGKYLPDSIANGINVITEEDINNIIADIDN